MYERETDRQISRQAETDIQRDTCRKINGDRPRSETNKQKD